MPSSTRLKVTPHNAAAEIGVFVGLFTIYVIAPVVAQVLVYGFIPDLISPIGDRLK
jgi:hypothetical protein